LKRTDRTQKRKLFEISWAEFVYTLLLEAILSGFVNASADQVFSRNEALSRLSPTTG